jgi:hypothetical protein
VKPDKASGAGHEFFLLLCACDEALAAGLPPPLTLGWHLEPGLRARLEHAVECMRLLRECLTPPGLGGSLSAG